MKRRWIWWIIILSLLAIIGSYLVCRAVDKQREQEQYERACAALFVTERDAVSRLYEAVGAAVAQPTQENYSTALTVAADTERVCGETFDELCNMVPTYGVELVYYATFYRDVKVVLSANEDTAALDDLHGLLEEIISLYDLHREDGDLIGEYKSISQFYESLSLLNEKMML